MSLARRLAKLEFGLKPPPATWPCTVSMRHGETFAEAYGRHCAEHGPKPKLLRLGLLVLPELPRTEEERITAAKRTEIRQAALLEFCRQPRQSKEEPPQ